MIRALLLALTLVLVIPNVARAACGVPPARAIYETPSVQVYLKDGHKVVACYRPTGKSRGVGENANDGIGTDESHTVVGVLGGRFIHMSFYASAAESPDVQMDSVVDLRGDQSALAPVLGGESDNQVVALAGAIVTAGEEGVIARFTDGRYEVLSETPADSVAAAGARLYWRDAVGTHTTVLTLPAPDARRKRPLARTIGRCKPRPGARLIVRDASIVLSRASGATWACRNGRTRRVGTGEARILSNRFVAYERPGRTGILDVANGKRRELPSTGPVVATAWALLAPAADGLRSWTYGDPAPKLIAPDTAREVAIGETGVLPVAFWLDAAGNPRSAAI